MAVTSDNPLSKYFANKPAEEVIGELKTRELTSWNALNVRGLPNLWRLSYAQAFGMDPGTGKNSTQKLEYCGPQQNYIRFRVNLTRSLIKQRNTMAAGQRISFQAMASNDDAESLAQVPIAGKVIDYVFREAEGERACYESLESDGYFGWGGIWSRWNGDGGDMVPVVKQVPAIDPATKEPLTDPLTGQPLMKTEKSKERSGAPTLTSVFPWQIFRDTFARKSPWIVIKEKCSKFELIAEYPEKATLLEGQGLQKDCEPGYLALFNWDVASMTDDMLVVKHFYHAPSKAVPGGRYIGYVNGVVLWDLACPVPDGLPLAEICSARYFDTQMGYPESADLFSLQEAIDEILSQSMTNIMKFGNQNIWGPDGLEFDQQKFMEGGSYFPLKADQEPPKVIQYATLPEAVKYLLEYLPERMNNIIGSNSVMRGEPQSNIQSGAYAALMQSIAEKFVSSTQAAFDFGVNNCGNTVLELVRANVDTSFAAEVAGDGNMPYMKFFTAEDIAGVKRVMVRRQNPLMNSIPGRFDVFNATKDLPKDQRHAAIQMLNTGDDSAWTENDFSALVLIRKENQILSSGREAMVSKTDDHFLHARKHNSSLDRLRTQDEPTDPAAYAAWKAAIDAHINHINEHNIQWLQTDKNFAHMLGLPPPPEFDPVAGKFTAGAAAPAGGPPGAPPPKSGANHKSNIPQPPEAAEAPQQAAQAA